MINLIILNSTFTFFYLIFLNTSFIFVYYLMLILDMLFYVKRSCPKFGSICIIHVICVFIDSCFVRESPTEKGGFRKSANPLLVRFENKFEQHLDIFVCNYFTKGCCYSSNRDNIIWLGWHAHISKSS